MKRSLWPSSMCLLSKYRTMLKMRYTKHIVIVVSKDLHSIRLAGVTLVARESSTPRLMVSTTRVKRRPERCHPHHHIQSTFGLLGCHCITDGKPGNILAYPVPAILQYRSRTGFVRMFERL